MRWLKILMLQCAVAFVAQSAEAAEPGAEVIVAQLATGKASSPACGKTFWVQGKGQASVIPPSVCPPINPVDAQSALGAAQSDAIFRQPRQFTCPAACPNLVRGQWSTTGVTCTSGKRITVLLIGGYEYECHP